MRQVRRQMVNHSDRSDLWLCQIKTKKEATERNWPAASILHAVRRRLHWPLHHLGCEHYHKAKGIDAEWSATIVDYRKAMMDVFTRPLELGFQ